MKDREGLYHFFRSYRHFFNFIIKLNSNIKAKVINLEEKKQRKAKDIYPLSGIVKCLYCRTSINPSPKKTRKKHKIIRYVCEGCRQEKRLSSVRADIIEEKIRDIIIDNLNKFHVIDIDNTDNQKKIKKLSKERRKGINALPDGIYPEPRYVNGTAIRAFDGSIDSWLEFIDEEIRQLEYSLVCFGDYKPIEEQEADYHERLKEILFSDDYYKINEFYKRLINVELDIEEKNGIISFLLPKKEFFPVRHPYYKFSWKKK